MQASGGAPIGGNVVPQPHLRLVVLPPHRRRRLVKVLAVEADPSEGVLAAGELGKGQEDSLQATHQAEACFFCVFFVFFLVCVSVYRGADNAALVPHRVRLLCRSGTLPAGHAVVLGCNCLQWNQRCCTGAAQQWAGFVLGTAHVLVASDEGGDF